MLVSRDRVGGSAESRIGAAASPKLVLAGKFTVDVNVMRGGKGAPFGVGGGRAMQRWTTPVGRGGSAGRGATMPDGEVAFAGLRVLVGAVRVREVRVAFLDVGAGLFRVASVIEVALLFFGVFVVGR